MKKRIVFIVFLVFAIVAAIIYFSRKNSTLKKELRDFAVEDTASVTKIFMVDKQNYSVLLERRPEGWFVNGRFPARKDAIGILLKTICRVDVKAPVPKASMDVIIRQLAGKSVKVEIYKGDELVKVYYVGGASSDQLGTYMLLEGSSVPFIMHIPGFPGFLTSRYFTDEFLWRDNVVFMSKFKDIKKVEVNYPAGHLTGFQIGSEDGKFTLSDLNGKLVAGYDSSKVRDYLSRYRSIKFESTVQDNSKRKLDSLKMQAPFAILSLENSQGKSTITLWFRPNINQVTDDNLEVLPYDPDVLYGWIENTNELLLCQFFVFDPLLKDVKFFLHQPL